MTLYLLMAYSFSLCSGWAFVEAMPKGWGVGRIAYVLLSAICFIVVIITLELHQLS